MNVCHIRRIHIVSSSIRIYLSIIKYPILQMKKFQTNNRIPQMSIMKNTPIVLTRYVSCTFYMPNQLQWWWVFSWRIPPWGCINASASVSMLLGKVPSGAATQWPVLCLYCALSIISSLRGPVQYQASLCARMEQSRAAAVQIIRTVSRGHTDINCNKFA